MPLDTIYLTRHGLRLNFTVDARTGRYTTQFPTPTGNPSDTALTSHGMTQSFELAAHIASPEFRPKPFRIYSSPFFRCLKTIQPTVERLKNIVDGGNGHATEIGIEERADLDVRIECGVGEWFGPTSFFDHPSPSTPSDLLIHFPTILHSSSSTSSSSTSDETAYNPHVRPSTRGETIAQLHNRVATALNGIIADVDAEIAEIESSQRPEDRTSKAILIISHAAPLIAIGRALTGNMPDDPDVEDFNVFTAGLSRFVRRKDDGIGIEAGNGEKADAALAPGTKILRPETSIPDWRGGNGVGGGWDCVVNGDCSFLSGGAERGWHFNGEESFDSGPVATPEELLVSGTKL